MGLDPNVVKIMGLLLAGALISVALWQIPSLRKVLTLLDQNRRLVRRDLLFIRRQTWRRIQMHFMLGLAGLGMLAGLYIPPLVHPLIWASSWCLVILFLFWAMILALADYLSIRLHFGRSLQQQASDKVSLEYQMKMIREALERQKNNHDPDDVDHSNESPP